MWTVLVTQSCSALCDFMNCSPPGFSVHGIPYIYIHIHIYLHMSIYIYTHLIYSTTGAELENLAQKMEIFIMAKNACFQKGFWEWKQSNYEWTFFWYWPITCPDTWWCVRTCVLRGVWLFATLWTVAHQAPLTMGFPRQEYWVGCYFLLQGGLPNPEIEPMSLPYISCIGRQVIYYWATWEADIWW